MGKNYDQKVDVFSFGILTYDIIFETTEPYGPNPPFGIDFKISQDPNCRPEIPKDLISYLREQCNFISKPKVF